jgi:hypothetical protein
MLKRVVRYPTEREKHDGIIRFIESLVMTVRRNLNTPMR